MVFGFKKLGSVSNCSGYDKHNGAVSQTTVAGGAEPYVFTWKDGVIASLRSQLAAGHHILTVTDAASKSITHSFIVRQPRQKSSAPLTLGPSRPSRWSARNQYFIDETPAASPYPATLTVGDYELTDSGLTEAGGNALGVNSAGEWSADKLAAQQVAVGDGAVTVSSSGIELDTNASIIFGMGTWRLRYEELNTELVFENLINGTWSRRFIID